MEKSKSDRTKASSLPGFKLVYFEDSFIGLGANLHFMSNQMEIDYMRSVVKHQNWYQEFYKVEHISTYVNHRK